MKTYRIRREDFRPAVEPGEMPVDVGTVRAVVFEHEGIEASCRELDPRCDLANHSPTGFEYGYPGSGPAQLALALVADALQDDRRALRVYLAFKDQYVARRPSWDPWSITDEQILHAVHAIETRREHERRERVG